MADCDALLSSDELAGRGKGSLRDLIDLVMGTNLPSSEP